MTIRRRIRIDLELPELTPAQADSLWTFLEQLAMDLWEAYEPELLELENERSRPPEIHTDSTGGDWLADDCEDAPPDPYSEPFRSDHRSDVSTTCGQNFTCDLGNDEPNPEF